MYHSLILLTVAILSSVCTSPLPNDQIPKANFDFSTKPLQQEIGNNENILESKEIKQPNDIEDQVNLETNEIIPLKQTENSNENILESKVVKQSNYLEDQANLETNEVTIPLKQPENSNENISINHETDKEKDKGNFSKEETETDKSEELSEEETFYPYGVIWGGFRPWAGWNHWSWAGKRPPFFYWYYPHYGSWGSHWGGGLGSSLNSGRK